MKSCKPIKIGNHIITGFDNTDPYDYIFTLILMPDEILFFMCRETIQLSNNSNINSLTDLHWMRDACFDECKRRGKPGIFDTARKEVTRN